MRLVLRLAFLYVLILCYLFLFAVCNLNCVWYRHVSRLAFRNKKPFVISVVLYSQNQTSIKIEIQAFQIQKGL